MSNPHDHLRENQSVQNAARETTTHKGQRMRQDSLKTLLLGAYVFYPPHGVAGVIGVEETTIDGTSQLSFVLRVRSGDRLLVPVDMVERAGVRPLVSESTARRLMELVAEPPGRPRIGPHRQRVYEERSLVRSGGPEDYTVVLRDLLSRSRSGLLAKEESTLLAQARDFFSGEMSRALKVPHEDVCNMLAALTTNAVA